jgi:hypothetical protein
MGHHCGGFTGAAKATGPQLVQSKQKKACVNQGTLVSPSTRRSILALTYDTELPVRNFRQVAKLANVPEATVYAVVRSARGDDFRPVCSRRAA